MPDISILLGNLTMLDIYKLLHKGSSPSVGQVYTLEYLVNRSNLADKVSPFTLYDFDGYTHLHEVRMYISTYTTSDTTQTVEIYFKKESIYDSAVDDIFCTYQYNFLDGLGVNSDTLKIPKGGFMSPVRSWQLQRKDSLYEPYCIFDIMSDANDAKIGGVLTQYFTIYAKPTPVGIMTHTEKTQRYIIEPDGNRKNTGSFTTKKYIFADTISKYVEITDVGGGIYEPLYVNGYIVVYQIKQSVQGEEYTIEEDGVYPVNNLPAFRHAAEITSVSPTSVNAAGATITLSGTNMQNTDILKIFTGSSEMIITHFTKSSTTITFAMPSVMVEVPYKAKVITNQMGESTSTSTFKIKDTRVFISMSISPDPSKTNASSQAVFINLSAKYADGSNYTFTTNTSIYVNVNYQTNMMKTTEFGEEYVYYNEDEMFIMESGNSSYGFERIFPKYREFGYTAMLTVVENSSYVIKQGFGYGSVTVAQDTSSGSGTSQPSDPTPISPPSDDEYIT
jgi:hypothetical protein